MMNVSRLDAKSVLSCFALLLFLPSVSLSLPLLSAVQVSLIPSASIPANRVSKLALVLTGQSESTLSISRYESGHEYCDDRFKRKLSRHYIGQVRSLILSVLTQSAAFGNVAKVFVKARAMIRELLRVSSLSTAISAVVAFVDELLASSLLTVSSYAGALRIQLESVLNMLSRVNQSQVCADVHSKHVLVVPETRDFLFGIIYLMTIMTTTTTTMMMMMMMVFGADTEPRL